MGNHKQNFYLFIFECPLVLECFTFVISGESGFKKNETGYVTTVFIYLKHFFTFLLSSELLSE